MALTVEEKRTEAPMLYERINASLSKDNSYEKANMETLFSYAFDRQKAVWEWCSYYFEFADRLPEVRKKLLDIMHNGSMRDRWITTINVYPDKVGADFCKNVIRLALVDNSAKVRLYGAMRAKSFCYKDLAESVNKAIDREDNEDKKADLRLCYRYLTEDFFIEKLDCSTYRVQHPTGYFNFEANIEDEKKLREYVIEHYSNRIYQGYWEQAK